MTPPQRRGQGGVILHRHQQATAAVLDDLRDAAHAAGHHRQAQAAGLQQGQGDGLAARGHDHRVHGRQHGRHVVALAQEVHPFAQPQFGGQPLHLPPPGRAGVTDQVQVHGRLGQAGQGAQGDVLPLVADEARHAGHGHPLRRDGQGRAQGGARRGVGRGLVGYAVVDARYAAGWVAAALQEVAHRVAHGDDVVEAAEVLAGVGGVGGGDGRPPGQAAADGGVVGAAREVAVHQVGAAAAQQPAQPPHGAQVVEAAHGQGVPLDALRLHRARQPAAGLPGVGHGDAARPQAGHECQGVALGATQRVAVQDVEDLHGGGRRGPLRRAGGRPARRCAAPAPCTGRSRPR